MPYVFRVWVVKMRVKIICASSAEQLEENVNRYLMKLSTVDLNVIKNIEYQVFVHPSGVINYSVMIVFGRY